MSNWWSTLYRAIKQTDRIVFKTRKKSKLIREIRPIRFDPDPDAMMNRCRFKYCIDEKKKIWWVHFGRQLRLINIPKIILKLLNIVNYYYYYYYHSSRVQVSIYPMSISISISSLKLINYFIVCSSSNF